MASRRGRRLFFRAMASAREKRHLPSPRLIPQFKRRPLMVDKSSLPVFKNDPIIVLVLGIITCGLYLIYWNIKIAEVFNQIEGKEVISPVVAVLAGCCMPVNAYFYYVCGQHLATLGDLTNNPNLKDKSTLLLILGIFFPMVSAMILQGHINELYD